MSWSSPPPIGVVSGTPLTPNQACTLDWRKAKAMFPPVAFQITPHWPPLIVPPGTNEPVFVSRYESLKRTSSDGNIGLKPGPGMIGKVPVHAIAPPQHGPKIGSTGTGVGGVVEPSKKHGMRASTHTRKGVSGCGSTRESTVLIQSLVQIEIVGFCGECTPVNFGSKPCFTNTVSFRPWKVAVRFVPMSPFRSISIHCGSSTQVSVVLCPPPCSISDPISSKKLARFVPGGSRKPLNTKVSSITSLSPGIAGCGSPMIASPLTSVGGTAAAPGDGM